MADTLLIKSEIVDLLCQSFKVYRLFWWTDLLVDPVFLFASGSQGSVLLFYVSIYPPD